MVTSISRTVQAGVRKQVALAEDHAHAGSEKSRRIALQILYVSVGASGFALLFLMPPHFDLRPATIASVAFVAAFLAYTERPSQSGGTTVAPMTAVIAASAVVFGYWTILLVIVALGAVRVRMHGNRLAPNELLTTAYFCQSGAGIIATYCMVALWVETAAIRASAPGWVAIAVSFFGILALGLIWQSIQNGLLYIALAVLGRSANPMQFLRVGVIASLYSYILVGLYSFGGILAAALFYILVAQTRAIEDIVGITKNLSKLDHAKGQATSVIRELARLSDSPGIQFTGEVENIAQMLARHIGLPRKQIQDVGLAAELHEIGKCRLPARLRAGHSANAAEEAQRRTYSRLGALLLRSADAIVQPEVADYIEHHTEHFDGTGYPRGLSGEAIPLPSRIIAVARGYVCELTGHDETPQVQKEEALRLLRQNSGTLYDPRLVDLLAELVN